MAQEDDQVPGEGGGEEQPEEKDEDKMIPRNKDLEFKAGRKSKVVPTRFSSDGRGKGKGKGGRGRGRV